MPEDKNKRLSSDEDSRLFREFIGQVKTLPNTQQHNFASKEKPKPVKKNFVINSPQCDLPFRPLGDIQADEHLFFARPGLQNKTIKKLKRGALEIDDTIDLHGLTRQQAEQVLEAFLVEQLDQQHRCILIIHGKGTRSHDNQPVLKNLCENMLKLKASVLAFCSAHNQDGGTGALYVLLKKRP
jgi:DNA-nicking Smr family endonuclease